MDTVIHGQLDDLARAIRAVVVNHRSQGLLRERQVIRVVRRNLSLNYDDDHSFGYAKPMRIEEAAWDSPDFLRFNENVIAALDEYRSLVSILGDTANLKSFARQVCAASFHGLDDRELAESANAFGREIEGLPLPISVTAYIANLSIHDSPIIISDRFSLRWPEEADVTEQIWVDENGGISPPSDSVWFHSIGELMFNEVSTGIAQKHLLTTLDALCLFRLGGVAAFRWTMQSRHSFLPGGIAGASTFLGSRYRYLISSSDAKTLREFLDHCTPLLPDPFRLAEETTFTAIAFARYKDALFYGGAYERIITSAVTCLEALFLQGEPELTHRLSQRVAIFLRLLGATDDALVTYNNVKKGYKIRSKFIHGSLSELSDKPQAEQLTGKLLEYARACTLAFLQLKIKKSDFLERLDNALLSSIVMGEIQKDLGSVKYH